MSWVISGIFGAFRALSDLLQDLSGAFGAYTGNAGTFRGLWIPRKGSKTKGAAIPPAPNPASLSKNGPIRLQLSKSCNKLCKELRKKTARKNIYIYKVPTPPWIILRETFGHCIIPIGRVAKHRPLAVPLKFVNFTPNDALSSHWWP